MKRGLILVSILAFLVFSCVEPKLKRNFNRQNSTNQEFEEEESLFASNLFLYTFMNFITTGLRAPLADNGNALNAVTELIGGASGGFEVPGLDLKGVSFDPSDYASKKEVIGTSNYDVYSVVSMSLDSKPAMPDPSSSSSSGFGALNLAEIYTLELGDLEMDYSVFAQDGYVPGDTTQPNLKKLSHSVIYRSGTSPVKLSFSILPFSLNRLDAEIYLDGLKIERDGSLSSSTGAKSVVRVVSGGKEYEYTAEELQRYEEARTLLSIAVKPISTIKRKLFEEKGVTDLPSLYTRLKTRNIADSDLTISYKSLEADVSHDSKKSSEKYQVTTKYGVIEQEVTNVSTLFTPFRTSLSYSGSLTLGGETLTLDNLSYSLTLPLAQNIKIVNDFASLLEGGDFTKIVENVVMNYDFQGSFTYKGVQYTPETFFFMTTGEGMTPWIVGQTRMPLGDIFSLGLDSISDIQGISDPTGIKTSFVEEMTAVIDRAISAP